MAWGQAAGKIRLFEWLGKIGRILFIGSAARWSLLLLLRRARSEVRTPRLGEWIRMRFHALAFGCWKPNKRQARFRSNSSLRVKSDEEHRFAWTALRG